MEGEGEQLCVCVCVCAVSAKVVEAHDYFELTANSLMSKLTVGNYSLAGCFDLKDFVSYLMYKM